MEDDIKFPKLYKSKSDGLVVEFDSLSSGIVVEVGIGTVYTFIGYYTNHWVDCTDTEVWEPVATVGKESLAKRENDFCLEGFGSSFATCLKHDYLVIWLKTKYEYCPCCEEIAGLKEKISDLENEILDADFKDKE